MRDYSSCAPTRRAHALPSARTRCSHQGSDPPLHYGPAQRSPLSFRDEATGLLPAASRSLASYRLYAPADVEPLLFICRAHDLGLHREDVRDVLVIRRRDTPPCDAVQSLLDTRVADIGNTAAGHLALRQTLVETHETTGDRLCGSPPKSARSTKTHNKPLAEQKPADVAPAASVRKSDMETRLPREHPSPPKRTKGYSS
ncbi:MerR family DNA-binding protein [Streptomyces sp. PRKS01-29]|nr:MerR family DNA-binding protein [Streptomyces sabulosicollis]